MNNDNRNLIAAIAISILILIVYQIYFIPPETDNQQTSQQAANNDASNTDDALPPAPDAGVIAQTPITETLEAPVASTAPRMPIISDSFEGTLSLAGGRLDDLQLVDYALSTPDDPERVSLLRLSGGADSYFAEVLFLDPAGERLVPKEAIWQASGKELTADTPISLSHTNEDGVHFTLTYEVDDKYLITITATAENKSGQSIDIRQFARIRRQLPSVSELFISYEGPIGVFTEGEKTEIDYDDVYDLGIQGQSAQATGINGWIGITDKYWLTAIIPDTGWVSEEIVGSDGADDFTFGFRRAYGDGTPVQVDVDAKPSRLDAGGRVERAFRIYAGPKEVNTLLAYSEQLNVERLEHAIDWGWFPFLTKPIFHALNWFFGLLGNFGLAIMALTVIVKLAFFPLANKSYQSMAKMRELAPKVKELRERFADDRQRQQKEMMGLYKQEKVNPAAGCLPVLLQIPVFFALYKVLFVTIEMRHAPFYGWITDLSAIDPTSIINLFGLLPFSTAGLPDIVNLGVLPILMGLTMHIQMSLNPPPPDPIQAKIFKLMPIFFTFLLATFPAGLVIYWTWNNLLSIIQQLYIMRSVKRKSGSQ